MRAVGRAYSASRAAWQRGPERIYDRLADVVAGACPLPLEGRRVLDLGAGTGSASRAARSRGARVIAIDVAVGMLEADAASRPPAVVGDALALPFAPASFDAVIASFCLNHVDTPAGGLREAARVLRRGGVVCAAAYAEEDHHPVVEAAESAALSRGWQPPPWYSAMRTGAAPLLATVDSAREVFVEAGLVDVAARHVRVGFADLDRSDLVAWRMGLAQFALFVATLSENERAALVADALDRLGDAPALERSLIIVSGRAAG